MRIIIFLSLFLSMMELQSKIITVDNTPGAGANYSSLSNAITAASAGDTIILMPSYTSYGSISLSKRLLIYSRGYSNNNLSKDQRAEISSATFNPGSENSVIKGLYMSSNAIISTDRITLQNNYINGILIGGGNNIIQGNVIAGRYSNAMIYFQNNTNACSNNLIINNYVVFEVNSGFNNGPSFQFVYQGNSSNLIANNAFVEIQSGTGTITNGGFNFFNLSFAQVYNNIMWSNVPSRRNFDATNSGSSFRNNLTYSARSRVDTLPGFNYNDTFPIFEGGYDTTNLPVFRSTNNMRLKSTSPGYRGGTDSTDVGIYGRNFPFSFEGNVPGVAIFDDFQVLNPVLKKGDTLKVKISGRKPE